MYNTGWSYDMMRDMHKWIDTWSIRPLVRSNPSSNFSAEIAVNISGWRKCKSAHSSLTSSCHQQEEEGVSLDDWGEDTRSLRWWYRNINRMMIRDRKMMIRDHEWDHGIMVWLPEIVLQWSSREDDTAYSRHRLELLTELGPLVLQSMTLVHNNGRPHVPTEREENVF